MADNAFFTPQIHRSSRRQSEPNEYCSSITLRAEEHLLYESLWACGKPSTVFPQGWLVEQSSPLEKTAFWKSRPTVCQQHLINDITFTLIQNKVKWNYDFGTLSKLLTDIKTFIKKCIKLSNFRILGKVNTSQIILLRHWEPAVNRQPSSRRSDS